MLPSKGWPAPGRIVLYQDDTGMIWPAVIQRTRASATLMGAENELTDNEHCDLLIWSGDHEHGHATMRNVAFGDGRRCWGWPDTAMYVDPAGPPPPRQVVDLTDTENTGTQNMGRQDERLSRTSRP